MIASAPLDEKVIEKFQTTKSAASVCFNVATQFWVGDLDMPFGEASTDIQHIITDSCGASKTPQPQSTTQAQCAVHDIHLLQNVHHWNVLSKLSISELLFFLYNNSDRDFNFILNR
jgi:hypothetical protein